MPKSIQESDASPANMVAVISKTKRHEVMVTITRTDVETASRIQEEQVHIIDEKVEEEEDTSAKPGNQYQIAEDKTRLVQLETDNTVRGRDNEDLNQAPNLVSSCEKEAEYEPNDDDKSVCTVQVSELDDLLPNDRKSIDEALECERSLRQELFLQ